MTLSSKEIADRLGTEHRGSEVFLSDINALDTATEHDLAYCDQPEAALLRNSMAGAIICPTGSPDVNGCTQLLSRSPRYDFAVIASEYFVELGDYPPIHPTAIVHPDASIGRECRIGPFTQIGAHVSIGDNCVIHSGTVIGGTGFGIARDASGSLLRLPHVGRVAIEDGVEIGPNCTIDRAMFKVTRIGSGTKLSAQIHVAHHVTIGSNTIVAFGAGFSGGATIGNDVTIHPQVAIGTDVSVGRGAVIGMNSTVLDDVPPDTTVVGSPATPVDTGIEVSSHGRRT